MCEVYYIALESDGLRQRIHRLRNVVRCVTVFCLKDNKAFGMS